MKAVLLGLASAAALLVSQGAQAVLVCRSEAPQATTNVTALANGSYQYKINITGTGSVFTVCGLPVSQVTDFYIPYFPDMGINFAGADFGGTYLSYGIESDSIFGLGGQVLHYRFTPAKFNDLVAQVVQFDASFGGAEAPFQSDLVDANGNRSIYMGDPLIPGSPETIAALDTANAVSEPGALAIFFSGLGLLVIVSRKTRGLFPPGGRLSLMSSFAAARGSRTALSP